VHGSETDSDETIRARLKQYINDANLTSTPFNPFSADVGANLSGFSGRFNCRIRRA
jgi:hypothetical protein